MGREEREERERAERENKRRGETANSHVELNRIIPVQWDPRMPVKSVAEECLTTSAESGLQAIHDLKQENAEVESTGTTTASDDQKEATKLDEKKRNEAC